MLRSTHVPHILKCRGVLVGTKRALSCRRLSGSGNTRGIRTWIVLTVDGLRVTPISFQCLFAAPRITGTLHNSFVLSCPIPNSPPLISCLILLCLYNFCPFFRSFGLLVPFSTHTTVIYVLVAHISGALRYIPYLYSTSFYPSLHS